MATRQDLGFAGTNNQFVSLNQKKKKPIPSPLKQITPPIKPLPLQQVETFDTPVKLEQVETVDLSQTVPTLEEQPQINQIEQALIKQADTIPTVQPTTDFSEDIRKQSQATTDALVAEIRNRINQGKQAQQQIIQQAPQQFDPLRAQSEVAKSQQLRSALERASLRGDRGGIGRSEALATQTAGEQRLNEINLAQQNVINNANAEIARLENEGRFEEARVRESQAAQLLNNLMSERIRVEDISRQDALKAEQAQQKAQELERDQFIQTIGRFAQDYTAEINRVQNDGDPRNDWQIPLLEQARQEKIVSQNLDPATGLPLPVDTTPNITSSSAAIDLWRQLGTANEAISRALGIPVGTRYTERATGGTGGLSSSSQVNLAKWKLDNNLPLTDEEYRILSIPEGTTLGTDQGFLTETERILNPVSIDTISDNKKAVLERLINNPSLHGNDPARLQSILDQQNITIDELEVYEEWRDRALADRAFQ